MNVVFMRERAKHYLALAETGLGSMKCDSYRELAALLEREADMIQDKEAREPVRPANDARPKRPEAPSSQRYRKKAIQLRLKTDL
jgi:hypothetical protein